MMTFAEASALFATAKFAAAGKPLATKLRLFERGPDCFAVRHHNTDIVLIYRDGSYVIDNGGWYSVTTKKHINRYSPVWIHQRDFVWYLSDGVEFTRHLRVHADGALEHRQETRPAALRVVNGGAS